MIVMWWWRLMLSDEVARTSSTLAVLVDIGSMYLCVLNIAFILPAQILTKILIISMPRNYTGNINLQTVIHTAKENKPQKKSCDWDFPVIWNICVGNFPNVNRKRCIYLLKVLDGCITGNTVILPPSPRQHTRYEYNVFFYISPGELVYINPLAHKLHLFKYYWPFTSSLRKRKLKVDKHTDFIISVRIPGGEVYRLPVCTRPIRIAVDVTIIEKIS